MQAIVLAGGFGTRLRQVVNDVPKPMAPIAGRPFLEILLNALARKGFTKVVLSVGFLAEKISDYFGASYAEMELVYSIEKRPLGTGGGVRLAIDEVTTDHVYIFNGDTFTDIEFSLIEEQWQARQRSIIVGCVVHDTSRYGRMLTNGDIAVSFAEKNMHGPGLINAGCYVISRRQLDGFAPGIPFSLETDFISPTVARGDFDVFVTSGLFIDIGVPEDYARAQTMLSTK